MKLGTILHLFAFSLVLMGCTVTAEPSAIGSDKAGTTPGTASTLEIDATSVDMDSPYGLDAQAYADSENVSLEEAVRRLGFQDSIGDIQPALMRDLADTFGGLWVQHQPDYAIFIALTDGDESAIQPYIQGKPWSDEVQVRQVMYTYEELRSDQQQASGIAKALDNNVTTTVDLRNNRVELIVGNPQLFLDALASAGYTLPDSVTVLAIQPDLPLPESNQGVVLEAVTGDGRPIFLPKQAPAASSMAALMDGMLVEVNGCLRITDQAYEEGFLVIWPYDSDMRLRGESIDILNGEMKVVAQVGKPFRAGGGAVESMSGAKAVDNSIPGMPLEGCSGPYWIAAPLETMVEQAVADVYVNPFLSDDHQFGHFIFQSRASEVEGTISGELVIEEGCMRVADHTILWPPNIYPREEPLRLVTDGEEHVAYYGDTISISGAVKEADDYRYFENKVDCPGPYWGANAVTMAE